MLKKEELLELLKDALKTEDSAIPLYTKHITSTLFLSGMDKQKTKRMREILAIFNVESTKHATMFKNLIKRIEEDSKDVY